MKRLMLLLALAATLAGCASSSEGGRFYTGAYGGVSGGGARSP